MSNNAGILYIVATPIGNLSDITDRARQILAAVDVILVEDSRHSGKLLKHLCINTTMQSYHDHNERQSASGIIEQIQLGKNMALISDAGTPLISDPGYHLVSAAHKEGIQVTAIPGASALIAALSISGLNSDRFSFHGFLPAKQSDRIKRLKELQGDRETLIFYETPHRVLQALEDCIQILGDRRLACIVRELTKLHEDVKRASLKELLVWLKNNPVKQKGEFVLLIEGDIGEEISMDEKEIERILKILLSEHSTKKAADIASQITGLKKNQLYKMALALV